MRLLHEHRARVQPRSDELRSDEWRLVVPLKGAQSTSRAAELSGSQWIISADHQWIISGSQWIISGSSVDLNGPDEW